MEYGRNTLSGSVRTKAVPDEGHPAVAFKRGEVPAALDVSQPTYPNYHPVPRVYLEQVRREALPMLISGLGAGEAPGQVVPLNTPVPAEACWKKMLPPGAIWA